MITNKVVFTREIMDQLPDADYVLKDGDVMLVMGSESRLRRFERVG